MKNRVDNDVGTRIINRLIRMTKANKLIWVKFNRDFHSHYKDIMRFRVILNDSEVQLEIMTGYHFGKTLSNPKNLTLLKKIRTQQAELTEEERQKALAKSISRSYLEDILDVLS